jgi:hypothetical protein
MLSGEIAAFKETLADSVKSKKLRGDMKYVWILLLGLALMGCETTARTFNKIKPGMSREDVVAIMGQPESVSRVRDTEVLRYQVKETINEWYPDTYYVQLRNGRVISSGPQSSFPASH